MKDGHLCFVFSLDIVLKFEFFKTLLKGSVCALFAFDIGPSYLFMPCKK